jgi:hypothetical protein
MARASSSVSPHVCHSSRPCMLLCVPIVVIFVSLFLFPPPFHPKHIITGMDFCSLMHIYPFHCMHMSYGRFHPSCFFSWLYSTNCEWSYLARNEIFSSPEPGISVSEQETSVGNIGNRNQPIPGAGHGRFYNLVNDQNISFLVLKPLQQC